MENTSWRSILTGAASALGIALFLDVLGFAIGLSALSTSGGATAAWLAVWSLIVPIIALFAGGLVGGRSGPRMTAAHAGAAGVAIWGLTYVVGGGIVVRAMASLATAPAVGPVGRFFRGMAAGGVLSIDQAAVYTWFLAASILLALIGAVVGTTLGARVTNAELREPYRAPREAHT